MHDACKGNSGKRKIENQWVKKREGGTWNSERRRNWRKERAEEWVLENWERRRRGSLGRHLHLHWTCCCCCGGKGISETSDGFSLRNHPTFPISHSPYYSLLISNQFCFLPSFCMFFFCFVLGGLGWAPNFAYQIYNWPMTPPFHLVLLAPSLPSLSLSLSPTRRWVKFKARQQQWVWIDRSPLLPIPSTLLFPVPISLPHASLCCQFCASFGMGFITVWLNMPLASNWFSFLYNLKANSSSVQSLCFFVV